ncbi:exosome complex component RRP4-like [Dysidea avara]|uniref:exosome complex component RRP4-like n=1 Tax=Dysidea avara TaxID=196820 RepID=UPI00331CA86A
MSARLDYASPKVVTPGEVITREIGFMRGHGTYSDEDKLVASVAGVVERVNKLICVRPFKTRYNGEIGDVVVGRVIEVQQKRWKIETFSRLDSVLLLSSINLPGGILRRRSAQDELMMRELLKEGDLISAEVQQVFSDGALSLHTRSMKYGKLGKGILVQVSPSLVKRCKNHMHNLLCGASIILGNNGYIWISPSAVEHDPSSTTMEEQLVAREDREIMGRLRNCIVALAEQKVLLYDTSIQYTYDTSLKYEVKELLNPDVMKEITETAQQMETE